MFKIDSIKPCPSCIRSLTRQSARPKLLPRASGSGSVRDATNAGRLVRHRRDWSDGHLALSVGRLVWRANVIGYMTCLRMGTPGAFPRFGWRPGSFCIQCNKLKKMDTSELAVRVRGLGVLLGLFSPQYSKYV